MAEITYADKDKNSQGVKDLWRDVDANEVKAVVNGKQDKHPNLSAISSVLGSSGILRKTGSGLWSLDGAAGAYVVATGVDDAYAITLSDVVNAYVAGMAVVVKFPNANTGPATLNVNGLGAKAINKNVTVALSAAEIKAGQIFYLVYDGANFQLIGSVGGSGSVRVQVDTTGADIQLDLQNDTGRGFIGSDDIVGNKNVLILNDANALKLDPFYFVATAGVQLTFEAKVRHVEWDAGWNTPTGLIWTAPLTGQYIMSASRINDLWFIEKIQGAYVNP